MLAFGCMTGHVQIASKTAQAFSKRLQKIKQHYQDLHSVPVFYQIGSYGLMTINKESWINQMIVSCGGHNVFADAKTAAPEIGWEAMLAADPHVVIAGALGNHWRKPWMKWDSIYAVKHYQFYTINPDLVERAGPRILEGMAAMCAAIDSARNIGV
jgi:iron complex transport system substrate-binding protein